MALGVTFADLRRELGRSLGWGRVPGSWTSDQISDGADVIKAGLRRFYDPPALPDERTSHEWSFLSPLAEIVTVADQYEYTLPADFAMLVGSPVYVPADGIYRQSLDIVGEQQVRIRLQTSLASTGQPTIAAVLPLIDTLVTKWQLIVWPIPDDAYTLSYRYRINPDSISTDGAVPLGGQPHAQTVIEAVLACAEEQFQPDTQVHRIRFMECLRTSVSHDRRVMSPDTLGLNRDLSDRRMLPIGNWRCCELPVVTYNGVAY